MDLRAESGTRKIPHPGRRLRAQLPERGRLGGQRVRAGGGWHAVCQHEDGEQVQPGDRRLLDLQHTLATADFYLAAGEIFSLTPQFGIFISAEVAGPNTVLLADPTGDYGTPTAFATLLNTHVSVAQLRALNAFSIS